MAFARRPKPKPLAMTTEEMASRIEILAGYGMTKKDICRAAGISDEIFDSHFAKAAEKGRGLGLEKVASALFQTAIDVKNPRSVSAQVFYLKSRAGWTETEVHRHESATGESIVPVINVTISGGKNDIAGDENG